MRAISLGWWFAWHPVRLDDTDEVVWLKRVYRERWGRDYYYYEYDNPF